MLQGVFFHRSIDCTPSMLSSFQVQHGDDTYYTIKAFHDFGDWISASVNSRGEKNLEALEREHLWSLRLQSWMSKFYDACRDAEVYPGEKILLSRGRMLII
jgi:hypothetical protein